MDAARRPIEAGQRGVAAKVAFITMGRLDGAIIGPETDFRRAVV